MPAHLRDDILVHITAPMVLNCDFFKDVESGFVRKIMMNLDQQFFSTMFMIMTTDTPANGMYFIKSGIVELMSDNDGILKLNTRLTCDSSFAEGCLLEYWSKNPFVARAGSDCELWFLSRVCFNRLIDDFPEVRRNLESFAAKANQSKKRAMTVMARQTILLSSERVLTTRHFLHPEHMPINVWNVFLIFFVLFNLIMVPLRVAFMENHKIEPVIAFDYFGDIFFIFDIIIRANFLGYFDDGHLIVSREEIRAHYMKTSHPYAPPLLAPPKTN